MLQSVRKFYVTFKKFLYNWTNEFHGQIFIRNRYLRNRYKIQTYSEKSTDSFHIKKKSFISHIAP